MFPQSLQLSTDPFTQVRTPPKEGKNVGKEQSRNNFMFSLAGVNGHCTRLNTQKGTDLVVEKITTRLKALLACLTNL